MKATFKANGDTMIYVMPSHVSLVRQEALPHLVGETVCSVKRVPPPRKILTGGLSKASTFRTTTPPTRKSFWPWVKGVLAAPPGQKVLLVMSALPGEGERGHGTRTRPTRTVASGNPEAVEKAETWSRASPCRPGSGVNKGHTGRGAGLGWRPKGAPGRGCCLYPAPPTAPAPPGTEPAAASSLAETLRL